MNVTYNKTDTLRAQTHGHEPIVLSSVGGCYSIDEKMGQTYVWHEKANTLASRDYKQPQAVLVRDERK